MFGECLVCLVSVWCVFRTLVAWSIIVQCILKLLYAPPAVVELLYAPQAVVELLYAPPPSSSRATLRPPSSSRATLRSPSSSRATLRPPPSSSRVAALEQYKAYRAEARTDRASQDTTPTQDEQSYCGTCKCHSHLLKITFRFYHLINNMIMK